MSAPLPVQRRAQGELEAQDGDDTNAGGSNACAGDVAATVSQERPGPAGSAPSTNASMPRSTGFTRPSIAIAAGCIMLVAVGSLLITTGFLLQRESALVFQGPRVVLPPAPRRPVLAEGGALLHVALGGARSGTPVGSRPSSRSGAALQSESSRPAMAASSSEQVAAFPPSGAGGEAESAAVWPLFWILTAPKYEGTRVMEIISSWGRMVPPDSLIFLGASINRTVRTGQRLLALPTAPEKKALKELLGWRMVVDMFPERDWYVKGDDDTYFVVDNLNRYLEGFDPLLPYFLGCKFHLGGPGGVQYVSGGAGYVLSREAAGRMAAAVAWRCIRFYGQLSEGDLAASQCLQTVGVVPEDTRDEQGRQRFHAFPYHYHLNWDKFRLSTMKFWYHDWIWGPEAEGDDCCGDETTVSFHYMTDRMRAFHFPPSEAERRAWMRSTVDAMQARVRWDDPGAARAASNLGTPARGLTR